MVEIVHHIHSLPVPPSERTRAEIPALLEKVMLACLEKAPADRPQSARALGTLLAQSVPEGDWNQEMAEEWWRLHMPKTAKIPAGETQ